QTGMHPVMAASYPICLDLYALVSFRLGRKADVATALVLMAISQTLTHLVSAHIVRMSWPIVVLVWAVILPLVIWRTHGAAHASQVAEPVDEPAAPVIEVAPIVAPVVEVAPVEVAPVVETPAAPVAWIGPGRRNYSKAEALAVVAENADKSNADLAAMLGRSVRMIRNYRNDLAAQAA